ncbi:PQQ-binding-like beta-propeller repeat protein [Terriglobus roseus]|nr:PQQ-binding-like beta-propeller repeat protein [Terriglobus roseus]
MDESKINPSTVGSLKLKWQFTTNGDVSSTPTVGDGSVYSTDWGGFIHRIDAETGKAIWSHKVSEYTGLDYSISRTSPALDSDIVAIGDQGAATVVVINKSDGSLIWKRTLDTTRSSYITSSPVIDGDRIYVGIASAQEYLASVDPTLVPDFRGSVVALDRRSGDVLWRTFSVPDGYSGGAVWGSSFVIDHKREVLYASTGNNYSIPSSVNSCITNASTPEAKYFCLDSEDSIDSILAIDLKTGRKRWGRRLFGPDTWTVACGASPNLGIPCPDNHGPDYDFGSAPNLFTVQAGGRERDVLGAGQKSGMYWALDPDTGDILWGTQVGPGGGAGGILWGSATDNERVYVALNNSDHHPYTFPGGQSASAGSWAGLSALTGKIEWQVRASGQDPLHPSYGAGAIGQMSVANGVVFAPSLSGDMVALDAKDGKTLWKFASGGSVADGPSIVDGVVYWGSGYGHSGGGTPNNKLYAFEVPKGTVIPGGGGVDASSGFSTSLGLNFSGSGRLDGTALQLTDGNGYEAGAAWSAAPVKATSFTSDFHFKITNAQADGLTFTIQNAAPSALGSAGGELGYNFIPNSIALKFDLYDNAGEGANSVGVYTAGNSLTGPGTVLPPDVSLLAGHTMLAHVTYDGYTLNLLLTDTVTGATATYRKVIDIPGTIGSNTAYVGFTGSTGGLTSTIEILDWVYKPGTLSIDSRARFENLGLSLNGTANIQGGTLLNMTQNVQSVPTAQNKAASAWTPSPFDITSFHSTFTFTNAYAGDGPPADGFTFTLQRSVSSAIGSPGGELGFNFIPNSVALKFDFFDNDGEGANTTGLYPAGVSLTDPTHSVPIGVDFLNATDVKADVSYDGTTLTLVLTDPRNGAASTWSKVVDLPAMLGGTTAFYGFTAGTGQLTTALSIESWTLVVGTPQ